MPLVVSGEFTSYIDALFEIVSGLTTTGASVVPNVEVLSKSILFWRSFSHWIGGMGVIVFVMTITARARQIDAYFKSGNAGTYHR